MIRVAAIAVMLLGCSKSASDVDCAKVRKLVDAVPRRYRDQPISDEDRAALKGRNIGPQTTYAQLDDLCMRDVKHVLELHPKADGNDYYLGIFLVGAYQEILGDLHNLFGDTNTVHVQLSPDGDYDVKEVVAGDTVSEVLQFVDYSPSDLLGRMRNNVEAALRKKLMTIEESRTLINRFRQGMIGYTYLDRE